METHNIRIFEPEQDYKKVASWWEAHGWEALPKQALPKLSVMYSYAGVDQAFAALYMDNSTGVCIMEWLVKNPTAPKKATILAVKHIIGYFREMAKEFDYGIMLTTCKQEGLAKLYERNGFNRTDEGMIHLVQTIN